MGEKSNNQTSRGTSERHVSEGTTGEVDSLENRPKKVKYVVRPRIKKVLDKTEDDK